MGVWTDDVLDKYLMNDRVKPSTQLPAADADIVQDTSQYVADIDYCHYMKRSTGITGVYEQCLA